VIICFTCHKEVHRETLKSLGDVRLEHDELHIRVGLPEPEQGGPERVDAVELETLDVIWVNHGVEGVVAC